MPKGAGVPPRAFSRRERVPRPRPAGNTWQGYENPNAWMKWLVLIVAVIVVVVGGLVLFSLQSLKGESVFLLHSGKDTAASAAALPGTKDMERPVETPAPAPSGELPSAVATEEQVVFRNGRPGAVLTVDGAAVDYQTVGTDLVVARSEMPDLAQVRIVCSTGAGGWETAAVWYNYHYGNDLTFGQADSYGEYLPCTQQGRARPSDKMVDVLTWAYYKGFLTSINEQSSYPMEYSTDANTAEQTEYIFSASNAHNTYDLDDFSAQADVQSILYDGDRVVYNAAFRCIATDKTTGNRSEIRNCRTIQLVWADGMWMVDRVVFLSESDFNARRYADLT